MFARSRSREIYKKHAKYSEIHKKFHEIQVGITYLKLILAVGAVYLIAVNLQIFFF